MSGEPTHYADAGSSNLLAVTLQQLKLEATDDALDLSYLSGAPHEDLANLIESVADSYRPQIWAAIEQASWWAVLHLLQTATAQHLLTHLTAEQQRRLAHDMSESDLIFFADILPSHVVDEFLDRQEPELSEQLQTALTYEEEQVGRYVDSRVLIIRSSSSLKRIQEKLQQQPEAQAICLIARDGNFVGMCDWHGLYNTDPVTKAYKIAEQMAPLDHEQKLLDAAQGVSGLPVGGWLPVVKDNKVIGVIAIENLFLRLKEKSLENFVSEAASEEEDLFTPIKQAAQIRAFWLLANLLTAFMASAVIGMFEKTLQQVVSLAILMPIVASMGGIAGSQTLAVALRGLALNHLHPSNIRMLLGKELKVAAINGAVLGSLIGIIVWQWFDSAGLGCIITIAIFINGLAAAASGTLIPFVLKIVKVDPAVAGAVILTTVTDIVGFILFLGLGSLLWSLS
ncbi:magnesium transporter [Neiella marina]|uniref:Magnesium transporter n=1 Tax=Neiella holothuriorum TaxID=2870530 RepID=A0ABS7EBC6_9GAMM|nr:magnesium transporter [Neiella holothuriorum]MBW8189643.1 magnesium transporter [Neiella holothuriorum]